MDAASLKLMAEVLEGISKKSLDYALVLAAVGTIAMALVELLKAVFRARLFFHRFMVEGWIRRDAAVRRELQDLAVGGPDNTSALYDQPSEKMLGQIQAAANAALDFPTVYPALYGFLAEGSATVGTAADRDTWRQFAPRMVAAVPAEGPQRLAFEADSRVSTQARARLGNLVTRKLDAFQTRVEYAWARGNQIVAVVGGALLLYYTFPAVTDSKPVPAVTRLALAALGGLVAPFAKDVVNALTGLRARR
jgi:hypothetical protein